MDDYVLDVYRFYSNNTLALEVSKNLQRNSFSDIFLSSLEETVLEIFTNSKDSGAYEISILRVIASEGRFEKTQIQC